MEVEFINNNNFNVPIPNKPTSFENGTYQFPEDWDELSNDDLATLALRISGWRSFIGAELSRSESKRRLLRQKYEYSTEKLIVSNTPILLKKSGYIDKIPDNGEEISPQSSHRLGHVKTYEFGQAQLGLKIKQELVDLWEDVEHEETKISMLKNMREAFESHEEVLGREISRRQSELRSISKF